MRVLLISPNREQLPDPVAPLGLAYLASALTPQGHEVRILDLCFAEDVERALRTSIGEYAPQVIGLSLRNIDNVAFPQTCSYLPFYKKIVEDIRGLSSAPLILGGSGFTIMPRLILRYLEADGGVVGEGESVLAQLLHYWKGGGYSRLAPMEQIEGFMTPQTDSPVRSAWLEDLDVFSPAWDQLSLSPYHRKGGMGNLQTKRGCPFTCLYCTYPLIEGRVVRLRSPEKVAGCAEALVNRGIGHAFIVDNIFNFPEEHARAVCRILREKEIPLQWSCYAHPRYFSYDLAKEMKEAGCTGVEFGTDSGSAPVLAKLAKGFTVSEVRQATRAARDAGLEVCHSLSLGAPGETEETLEETFALMEDLGPTAVIAMVGLRIFPRTGLARLAREEGLVKAGHDFLQPTFYIAPAVRDFIVEWARDRSARVPNWIFPGLGIQVSLPLQSKLRRIGVKGPLWEHLKILRGRKSARKGSYV